MLEQSPILHLKRAIREPKLLSRSDPPHRAIDLYLWVDDDIICLDDGGKMTT